ncbi:hypothetical protein VE00_07454 [Pseudogymnoascus sp. WSF 3629]|nr:hypothetical protein VE00_07454 [Pseudogymnoascus sp. WSF 3629]
MAVSLATPPPIAADAPSAPTLPAKEEGKLQISVGGKGASQLIQPAVTLIAPTFATDPLITYFLNGLPREQRIAYLPRYFTILMTAAAMNKGCFYHTDELESTPNTSISPGARKGEAVVGGHPWRSTVVLVPPGESIDNPLTMIPSGLTSMILKLGLGGIRKMLFEFEGACKSARKAGLRKGEDPYYIFFVGTAAAYQGRGLGGEMVKEVLGRGGGGGGGVGVEGRGEGGRGLEGGVGGGGGGGGGGGEDLAYGLEAGGEEVERLLERGGGGL